MKNYNVDECKKSLNKKNDVRVITEILLDETWVRVKQINVLRKGVGQKKDDLGNGSWGKIDFLRKNGFAFSFVDKFRY